MIRDCAAFLDWLDGDRDATLESSAHAHAAGCAACAAALALEAALAAPPLADAGAGFTEGVMLRVREGERAAAASRLAVVEAPPAWWVSAPAEPAAALALGLAALLAWRGDGLWAFALQLAARAQGVDWAALTFARLPELVGRALAGHVSGTIASGTLVAVLLPLVGVASWALYRGLEQAIGNTFSGHAAGASPGAARTHRA